MSEGKNKDLGKIMTRRGLLERATKLAAAAIVLPKIRSFKNLTESYVSESRPALEIVLGQREEVLPLGAYGLRWFPDTATSSLWNENGNLNLFISGGLSSRPGRSFLLKGADMKNLRPHQLDENGEAAPILTPDPTAEIGQNYLGIGSVLNGNTPNQLIGLVHTENSPNGSPFLARVGITTSEDNGITWSYPTKILTGRNESEPGSQVTGAGQPSAVVVEVDGQKYIRVYYTDWSTGDIREGKSAYIHVAQAPLESCTDASSWKKYFNGDFTEPGIAGDSSAVISTSDPKQDIDYVALASLKKLDLTGGYISVQESDDGVYACQSIDGLTWSERQMFLPFLGSQQKGFAPENKGKPWEGYFSMIDLTKPGEPYSSDGFALVGAAGIHGQKDHSMIMYPIEIKGLIDPGGNTYS